MWFEGMGRVREGTLVASRVWMLSCADEEVTLDLPEIQETEIERPQ